MNSYRNNNKYNNQYNTRRNYTDDNSEHINNVNNGYNVNNNRYNNQYNNINKYNDTNQYNNTNKYNDLPNNKRMNVSFTEICNFVKQNPNQSDKLTPIEVTFISSKKENNILDSLFLSTHNSIGLSPFSPLSTVAWIHSAAFRVAFPSIKNSIIREFATKIQEKTNLLQGTPVSRKRKQMHDIVGALSNNSRLNDKEMIEFYNVISYMLNVQLVLIKKKDTHEEDKTQEDILCKDSSKGEIIFGSNPLEWKRTTPIWIADYYGGWIADTRDDEKKETWEILGEWLDNCENDGWVISWREYDGKKDEILKELEDYPCYNPLLDKKLKKEELSKKLGKAKCQRLFYRWEYEVDADGTADDIEYMPNIKFDD